MLVESEDVFARALRHLDQRWLTRLRDTYLGDARDALLNRDVRLAVMFDERAGRIERELASRRKQGAEPNC